MKTHYVFAMLIVSSLVLAYDYDVEQPTKTYRPLTSKISGGNDDAQLPYHYYPFAYDTDTKTGMKTVYYHITNDYGQSIIDLSAWLYPGESIYLLNQRIEMQVWIEYEAQAGDLDTALQYYIRNYSSKGLICQ